MKIPDGSFAFAQPGWLWLLVPALLLAMLRRGTGASTSVKFPNLAILRSLGKRVRHVSGGFAVPLALLALVSAIIAMARPVWRNYYESRTASGIDIVIAFDVSLSMDIDDFVDRGRKVRRIEVAKAVVDDFISRRPEDRMGLVAFAGRPRDCSPITLDHNWLRQALRDLRLNLQEENGTVKEQGTAIGSALSAAAVRLNNSGAKSKVIVLITDGASNSGKISPVEAAEHAKTLGIKIYTIAIGTEEGRVDRSIMRFPYQEFDLPTLRKIASLTGGEHFWAQDFQTLKDTFRTINDLEKTETKTFTTVDDRELFMWFAAAALAAAMSAALISALNPPPAP